MGGKGDADPEETNRPEEAPGEAAAGRAAAGKPAQTTVWARARRDAMVEGVAAATGKAARTILWVKTREATAAARVDLTTAKTEGGSAADPDTASRGGDSVLLQAPAWLRKFFATETTCEWRVAFPGSVLASLRRLWY